MCERTVERRRWGAPRRAGMGGRARADRRRRRRPGPLRAGRGAGRAGTPTSSLIVAADGGWDKAASLGLRPGPAGRRRRLAARGSLRGTGRAGRPDRALPDGQGRVGRGAGAPGRSPAGGDPRDDPRGPGRQAFRPRPRERRPAGAAGPGVARWSCWTRTTRVRLLRAPARGRSRGSARSLRGRAAIWSRCCRSASPPKASPRPGLSTRSATRPCGRDRPAGSPTSESRPRQASRSAAAIC